MQDEVYFNKFLITPHAIARFQERVFEVDEETARAYIQRALDAMKLENGPKPEKRKDGSWSLFCNVDGQEFILYLNYDGDPRVSTVTRRLSTRFDAIKLLEQENGALRERIEDLQEQVRSHSNGRRRALNRALDAETRIKKLEEKLSLSANPQYTDASKRYKELLENAKHVCYELQIYLEDAQELSREALQEKVHDLMRALKPDYKTRAEKEAKRSQNAQDVTERDELYTDTLEAVS